MIIQAFKGMQRPGQEYGQAFRPGPAAHLSSRDGIAMIPPNPDLRAARPKFCLIQARVDTHIRNVSIEINRVIAVILLRYQELPLANDQWDAYGADEIVMGPNLSAKAGMARGRQVVL